MEANKRSQNVKTLSLSELKDELFGQIGSEERKVADTEIKRYKIGKSFREKRLEIGMSKEDVARKMNKSIQEISAIESGEKELGLTELNELGEQVLGGTVRILIE